MEMMQFSDDGDARRCPQDITRRDASQFMRSAVALAKTYDEKHRSERVDARGERV